MAKNPHKKFLVSLYLQPEGLREDVRLICLSIPRALSSVLHLVGAHCKVVE